MVPRIRQWLSHALAWISDWALIASLVVGGFATREQIDDLKREIRRSLREGW